MNKLIYLFNRTPSYLFLLIIGAVFAALASNQFFIHFINSDWLFGFETAKNIIDNKTIAGHDFPAAPYFFPDILMLVLLNLFTHNVVMLNFIYSLLFLSTYVVSVYFVFKSNQIHHTLATLGVLIAFSAFFFIIPSTTSWLRVWQCSHLSILLFGFMFLIFYLNQIRNPLNTAQCVLLFVLTYVLSVSDGLFIIQSILPISTILVAEYFLKRVSLRNTSLVILSFAAAIFFSIKTPHFLTHFFHVTFGFNHAIFSHPALNLAEIKLAFSSMKEVVLTAFHYNPLFESAILFYNVFAFILGVLFYKRCFLLSHQHYRDKFIITLSYLYLSQVCSVVVAFLAGKIDIFPHLRYVDTLAVLPSIILAYVVIHLFAIKAYTKFLSLFVSVLLIVSVIAFFHINPDVFRDNSFQYSQNRDLVRLDALAKEYHLENGIANYWLLRPIRMFSQQGVRISQVTERLDFINMADDKTYFYNPITKQPLSYQFIIINNLQTDFILHAVGKPDKIISCSGDNSFNKYNTSNSIMLWLYTTKASQKRLNDYLRPKVYNQILNVL